MNNIFKDNIIWVNKNYLDMYKYIYLYIFLDKIIIFLQILHGAWEAHTNIKHIHCYELYILNFKSIQFKINNLIKKKGNWCYFFFFK